MKYEELKSGLVVASDGKPVDQSQPVDRAASYNRNHCCCPRCGYNEIESTCVGYIAVDWDTYQDGNRANCRCGWRGIVHDLISSEAASKLNGPLNPIIRTERFEIFKATCLRTQNGCDPRDVYLAFFHSQDVPRPVCTLTIWDSPKIDYRFVEWVHVEEGFRRQGIASEVVEAVEAKIGLLRMDGATDEGDAFCAAYEERH